ncbi:MAG: GNAT family N-acetyltransferase [Desulfobacterales bacterium]|nr:GNAT family N-acetyltransferase [Desulfobacterales bacterium]
MKISLRFDTEGIDWLWATDIFRLAPLGTREPRKLKRAFENSTHACFAWNGDLLVGMARALSDDEYQAVVYDLVVLPEYQGQGVGRQIMAAIHRRLSVRTIILYAVPGKESFYQKLGYAKMLTAMARRAEDVDAFRNEGYIE